MLQTTLYQRIFGKGFTEAGSAQEIKECLERYPWFSLAHFYRLKGIGLTDKQFKNIAPLTALYFNNPFLLNRRLQQNAEEKISQPGPVPVQEHEVDHPLPILEPVTDNLPHEHAAETKNTDMDNPKPEFDNPIPVEAASTPEIANETQNQKVPFEIPLFEPLHASDYFASQGIKLSEENLGDDQLGKKMRRFTDWLKTMKKTPMQENKLTGNPEDYSVTHLADKSNQDSEVLTETMARVLEQQGKYGKALEIYKKLSLINPDKSAYFAAKIENLNDK